MVEFDYPLKQIAETKVQEVTAAGVRIRVTGSIAPGCSIRKPQLYLDEVYGGEMS